MPRHDIHPDPRQHEPRAPFPAQQQPTPGRESEMIPRPDYGEQSYKGSGKLEGKVALITGADSGIGRAVALAFAREGANIFISYLNELEDAQETERVVREAGREAITMAGDIQDEDHCKNLVLRCMEEFGRLDILVNNAAFQQAHEQFTDITAQELDRTYRTNVYAMFYLCSAAVPHMSVGSSIINVASIQAYQPRPQLLAYASTKGAIVTFSKGLSKELISKGIRVNVVAPGPVWTPLIVSSMPNEKVKHFGEQTPIGRTAQPAEIAPTFVFLASDDSRYVSGEVVGVTGGEFTM
jgi:NAD(P)-dependent dehydrogenase (short-subunit alcohol dehydrogenase family)